MLMKFIYVIIILHTSNVGLLATDPENPRDEFKFKEWLRTKRQLYDSTHYEKLYNNMTFDFIVVGSGAAGSVIANRLTENPNWNVLLLEVGDEATIFTDVPVLAPVYQFTDLSWNYLMEKQENMCLGLKDERMAWPRGRALGGSSVINYMIHTRGNREDFNKIAQMGNKGWSYKEVLPYYIKSEDCGVLMQDPGYHQRGGYLGVNDVPYRTESAYAFINASMEAGHRYVDYNGKKQLGVSFVHATITNGLRNSAEKTFLRPIRHRRNLVISVKSRVTKLLIDTETKSVYGVEVHKNRQIYRILASKEVILSAGAFNSPQILMLSGIGPKQHLLDLNIVPIHDLPVGEKLYDHLTFHGLIFTVEQPIVSDQKVLERIDSFIKLANGQGPLTSLGGVEALLFFQTNTTTSRTFKTTPDMEIIFISGGLHTDKDLVYRKVFRISDKVYNAIWKPLEDKYALSLLPLLLHPKSYGHLKLKSKNPYHWPKFYGNFFTDPNNDDIKAFIAAIREMQRIMKQATFQKYGAKQVTTPIPGCERFTFDTDEYWECALRHVSVTLHHQVATCKMGPNTDLEAVVDSRLKVYGVKNLRVADTSIIPIPLSAHTNVPAVMIGERAADFIKEDHC